MDRETLIKSIKRRRWVWMLCLAIVLLVLWEVFTSFYREEEKELRRQLRETVKEQFPEQTAKFSQTIGLFLFEADPQAPRGAIEGQTSVVLIHGLDDPGQVWQNLAPALAKEKFNVWRMHYPNDQPVVESAQVFFEARV